MARNTGNLYLQLSANTDTYVRALKAAKASTQDFAGDVDAQISGVQAAFDKLGAANVGASAKAMEASFRASFANIGDLAEKSLTLPKTDAGALSINLVGAQQAQADAERVAIAYRELADAAARVVIGNDAASDAEKRNAVTAEARARAAESVVASTRQEVAALQSLQRELDAAGASGIEAAAETAVVAEGHNKIGASGLIAEHVVRSFSDSLVAGQDPARAFAQQLPRIGEAFTLMSLNGGESTSMLGRFAGFMGGPWGIAITAGISLATVFGEKLLDAGEAAEAAKAGSDGLAEAQGALGKIFDLTSGKLEHQNQLLALNARLTALNLRAEAEKERASSQKTYDQGGTGSFLTEGLNAMAVDGRGQAVLSLFGLQGMRNTRNLNQRNVASLVEGVRSGRVTPEVALRSTEGMNFTGAQITKEQLQQAIIDASASTLKTQIADKIDQSLDSGTLDPDLKRDTKPKRPRKPRVDHTAEREANADRAYQNQDRQADDAIAKAQADLAGTIEARYQVQLDQLRSDLASKEAALQDEVTAKKLSQPQADSLKAKLQEAEKDQEILLDRQKQSDLIKQQLQQDQLRLDGAKTLLDIAATFATTTAQRRDIALQQLALDEQRLRTEQNAIINDPKSTDVDRTAARTRLDQIDEQHAGRVGQIDQQNASPLQAYALQLHKSTDDMGEALQGVGVDALNNFGNALEGIASHSTSVSKAISSMTTSILGDLLKLEEQKLFASLLTNVGFGGLGASTSAGTSAVYGGSLGGIYRDGGLPGFASGAAPSVLNGLIRGPGSGRSDSILASLGGRQLIRVSNGEGIVNARAVQQYWPVIDAMNKGTFSAFADGGLPGSGSVPTMRDISRGEMQQVARHQVTEQHFHITNSFVEQKLWEQVHGIAQQHVTSAAPSIAAGGAQLADHNARRAQRRQLF